MDEDGWVNEAGHGARQKSDELRAKQSTFIRVAARVLGVHTEERAWRRGAEGEERVGQRLARLPEGWQVLHDLTIGSKGANLDHLVIGPPGVFVLNTKHLTGKVTVYDRSILHNGRKTSFVPKALAEVAKVQERLTAVIGREVLANSVLVVVGAEIDRRKRPTDFSVVSSRRIPKFFTKQSKVVLSSGEVTELAAAACLPSTWSSPRRGTSSTGPTRTDEVGVEEDDQAASEPSPSVEPPEPAPTDAAAEALTPHQEIVVRRWRRYGKDRLYANASDGRRLGWLDLVTDELHVEEPGDEVEISRAVANWRAGT